VNDLAGVLARVASIGPFFELSTSAEDAGWQRFSGLWTDPAVLEARITATREALSVHGAIEWRVAASLAQLNLAARVLSPVIGCAVVAGAVPVVSPDLLWWQPVLGGAFPFALVETRMRQIGLEDPASAARAEVAPILDLLVEGTHRVGGLSTQIAWGNVDSAAEAALALVRRALGQPVGPAYRRSTCCLFYRVSPGAGLCGDCVLDSRPGG
jgi:hypothetical protein